MTLIPEGEACVGVRDLRDATWELAHLGFKGASSRVREWLLPAKGQQQ